MPNMKIGISFGSQEWLVIVLQKVKVIDIV
jgi:hypothetical protein